MKEAKPQKPHIVWFSLYEKSRVGKSQETGRFPRGSWGEEGEGGPGNDCWLGVGSPGGDGNVLKVGSGDSGTTRAYIKCHWIV